MTQALEWYMTGRYSQNTINKMLQYVYGKDYTLDSWGRPVSSVEHMRKHGRYVEVASV